MDFCLMFEYQKYDLICLQIQFIAIFPSWGNEEKIIQLMSDIFASKMSETMFQWPCNPINSCLLFVKLAKRRSVLHTLYRVLRTNCKHIAKQFCVNIENSTTNQTEWVSVMIKEATWKTNGRQWKTERQWEKENAKKILT